MGLCHGQNVDDTGVVREIPVLVDASGRPLTTAATHSAGERIPQSANESYIASHQEWRYTPFNPRAASTGSTKGAAGSAGATEILVASGPVIFGGITTESDTVAGDILVRDAAVVNTSAVARVFASILNTVSTYEPGWIFRNGLCVCGSLAGVAFTVKWKVAA